MAKSDRKGFFIRLPDPNTGDWKYVEVDVNRLGPETVRKIYNRTSARDSGSAYRPAEGLGIQIDNLDVSDLLSCIRDMREQCENSLRPFDEDGQRVLKSLLVPLDLETVIRAVANRDLEQAKKALTEMLYLFLSGLCEVAESLQKQRHLSSALDGMSTVIESSDNMTQELLFEWAEAADTIVTTTEELGAFETELRSVVTDISSERQWWEKSFSRENSTIGAALKNLDGENGFRIIAFNHIRNSETVKFDQDKIDQARQSVMDCLSKEQEVQRSHQQLCSRVNNGVLLKRISIQQILGKLDVATKRFLDFRRRFRDGAEQMFSSNEAHDFSLTRDRYALAEEAVRNKSWAPIACRRRIEGLITTASRVLDENPRLPADITRVLSQTQEYIEQIEEAGLKPTKAKPRKISTVIPRVRKKTLRTIEGKVSNNGDRAQELYEMVICVAFVLTCNHYPLARSNMGALLSVLPYLGRCDEEELQELKGAVFKLSKQRGEWEKAEKNPIKRWGSSRARWISFNINNKGWAIKLTKSSTSLVRRLLVRHGLTTDEIREAHTRRRLDKEREHKERKRKA